MSRNTVLKRVDHRKTNAGRTTAEVFGGHSYDPVKSRGCDGGWKFGVVSVLVPVPA